MAVTVLRRSAPQLEAATSLALATVRPDGRPHVDPVWFYWDGEAFVVLTKPHAQKVRNLLSEPRAMVSIGQPGSPDATLVEVTAEVETDGAATIAGHFAAKYRGPLEALGLTIGRLVETYPSVIRLRPTRRLSWGHPG